MTATEIWNTGIEIIYEQWKLLLDEAPEEDLGYIWTDIYDALGDWSEGFEDWLEEQA